MDALLRKEFALDKQITEHRAVIEDAGQGRRVDDGKLLRAEAELPLLREEYESTKRQRCGWRVIDGDKLLRRFEETEGRAELRAAAKSYSGAKHESPGHELADRAEKLAKKRGIGLAEATREVLRDDIFLAHAYTTSQLEEAE